MGDRAGSSPVRRTKYKPNIKLSPRCIRTCVRSLILGFSLDQKTLEHVNGSSALNAPAELVAKDFFVGIVKDFLREKIGNIGM